MSDVFQRWRFANSIEQLRDLPSAIENFILPGFLPEHPVVHKTDIIYTQGSCFAENLAAALQIAGQPVDHMSIKEVVNSPLANKVWLEYALEHLPYATKDHAKVFSEDTLEALRVQISRAKLIVFTVGVAICMFENETLLMTLSRRAMREGNALFRLTTVDENAKWLTEITQLLRKFNPNLYIVFTLSPVPLAASFIHESVIASDCLSKSTLRLALAKFMSQGIPGTYYWPAFEIVRWLSGHTMPMFGTDDGVPRHVSTAVVKTIVDLFLKHYVA